VRELLEYHWSERDDKDNRDLSLPSEEKIELHAVLMIEAYTPTNFANLTDWLTRQGWGDEEVVFAGPKLLGWVTRARASSSGGGGVNVGLLTRPGTTILGECRLAELPSGVDRALAWISFPTPSLTLLCVTFMLDDETATRADAELREDRQTYATKVGGSYRFWDPPIQKREAVRHARLAIRSALGDWLKTSAPGVFASTGVPSRYPACEIWTTQVGEPFGEWEGGARSSGYASTLDWETTWQAWEAEEMQGFRLGYPRSEEERDSCLVLAGKRGSKTEEKMLSSCGGESRWAFAYLLDSDMRELVSRWALNCLLIEYQEELSAVRDLMGRKERHSRLRRMIQSLEALQGSLDVAAEAEMIGLEAGIYCRRQSRYKWDCPNFMALAWWPEDDRPSLVEILRKEGLERSYRLRQAARGVGARTQSFAELSNAITGLRLQVSVRWLTAGALAVSLAALIVAAVK